MHSERDGTTAPAVDKRLDALRASVDADITLAWTRKTSFETRALALVTSNFAGATLFFLINRELGYEKIAVNGFARTMLVVALAAAVVSVVAACLTLMLANYRVLPAKTYERVLREVDRDDVDVVREIVDMRIGIYGSARHSNGRKALFLLISMLAFAVAVLSYVAAIVLSVL